MPALPVVIRSSFTMTSPGPSLRNASVGLPVPSESGSSMPRPRNWIVEVWAVCGLGVTGGASVGSGVGLGVGSGVGGSVMSGVGVIVRSVESGRGVPEPRSPGRKASASTPATTSPPAGRSHDGRTGPWTRDARSWIGGCSPALTSTVNGSVRLSPVRNDSTGRAVSAR